MLYLIFQDGDGIPVSRLIFTSSILRSDTHNRSASHASYITPVVHKDCYKYVTMISIIDVDIYQWCKSYRKNLVI